MIENINNINSMSFYDLWVSYDKYQKSNLKVQSYRKFKNDFKIHLLPYFKDYLIKDITADVYLNWKLSIDKLGYSFAYKKSLHIYMVSIFNFAIKFYDLAKNIPSLIGNFNRSKCKPTKVNFWTLEEFNTFINCVDNIVYRTLFDTLYYTGLRIGECLALTWDDFINNDYLDINKTLTKDINPETGKPFVNAPKTPQSIRRIKLDKELISELQTLKALQEKEKGHNTSWYIFGGNHSLSQTTVGRIKNKYCDISKVKKIRLHDFRHSHATLLLSRNVPITVISQRLGHKDIALTLNTYSHLITKDIDEAVELLNSIRTTK